MRTPPGVKEEKNTEYLRQLLGYLRDELDHLRTREQQVMEMYLAVADLFAARLQDLRPPDSSTDLLGEPPTPDDMMAFPGRPAPRSGQWRSAEAEITAVSSELSSPAAPPSWEQIKKDPDWQQRWDELLARIQSRVPAGLTEEEIEAAVKEARDEVRADQRARRR